MSGIFGAAFCAEDARLKRWMAVLEAHTRIYGADGSRQIVIDRAAMGCHLEHFSQAFPAGAPVLESDHHLAVIDALLYNRDELLPLVSGDAAMSDGALLLALIEARGEKALAQVNGDFAGAVYDKKTRAWRLFRDHTGVRPLYVYHKDGEIAFSTELRALTAMPGMDSAVDERSLYLRMMGAKPYTADNTDFSHIRMMPAGHVLWLSEENGKFHGKKEAYYVPGRKKIRLRGRKAYERELYRLVGDAVRRRLDAVPGIVGAELSGGLDSGVIDVMINRAGRAARYLSWSPSLLECPMQEGDERQLIDAICRQEEIRCDYLQGEAAAASLFERKMPPFADTLAVGQTARWMHEQHVRVVFSGHGGDEGASHRMSPDELWHHGEYAAWCREEYHALKGRKLRAARTAVHFVRKWRAGKTYIRPWTMKNGKNGSLLSPAFYARMKDTPLPSFSFGYDPAAFVADGGQRARADNAAWQAAEHGVRYVFPLMDRRVMTFALGIPRRMYLRNGQDRLIFRRAFCGLLPKAVCERNGKSSPGRGVRLRRSGSDGYAEDVNRLLDALDDARWAPYLNMELIRSIRDTAGMPGCPLSSYDINNVFLCLLIQKMQDEGKKDEPA